MRLFALLLPALLWAGAAYPADPPEPAKPAPAIEIPERLSPEEVDALLARITDTQARQLLARQLRQEAERRAQAKAKEDAGMGGFLVSIRLGLEGTGDALRARVALVREGWPMVSGSIATSMNEIAGGKGYGGFRRQTAALFGLVAAGLLAQWLVRRRIFSEQARSALAEGAGLGAKLAAAGYRLLLELLPYGAFCLMTVGLAALLFDPGGADRTFHVTYTTGAAIIVGVAVLARVILSPGEPAFRLLPVGDANARFIRTWLLWVTGVGVFAWLTAGLLILTGVPVKARLVIELITGAIVGVAVLLLILSSRRRMADAIRAKAPAEGAAGRRMRHFAGTWHIFAILYLLLIWLFWSKSLLDQGPSTVGAAIASVVMVLVFPLLDRWIGRGIDDMVGGSTLEAAGKRQDYAVVLHRVMRVLLVVILVAGVNQLWGFDGFGDSQVKLRQVLLSASLDLIAALVLAVIGWQFIKIGIDRRLVPREVDGVTVPPSQRMQTLLPLLRKFVVVVLIVMTIMLVLSALGVNIGPLLAGAGVVGLAIGFGAQTLVKDVIGGVFFLVDDAFRVGEYIVSGSYKGTVEAIGMRSVKLRHHRGSVFTVPYGELNAVQNMSRDWVIDKLTIGITYDSDIEKARKLIKKIGQELAADPAHAPHIIEPLKMQGVEQFGDFAIQIRMKMMTKPGEQFVIRRKAYAMIKKAFDANGVKFAFPTVQLAGGGEGGNAAAAAAASVALPPKPPAA
jgi:small-conductance mechanosensitive channel